MSGTATVPLHRAGQCLCAAAHPLPGPASCLPGLWRRAFAAVCPCMCPRAFPAFATSPPRLSLGCTGVPKAPRVPKGVRGAPARAGGPCGHRARGVLTPGLVSETKRVTRRGAVRVVKSGVRWGRSPRCLLCNHKYFFVSSHQTVTRGSGWARIIFHLHFSSLSEKGRTRAPEGFSPKS